MSRRSSIEDVSTYTCALLQKEEGCSQLVGQESVVVPMCQCGDNKESQGGHRRSQGDNRGSPASSGLGWQLVVLVAVASAALVTIVLISQQLVLRHLGGGGAGDTVTMQITIPDQGWMSSEGGWNIHSSFFIQSSTAGQSCSIINCLSLRGPTWC